MDSFVTVLLWIAIIGVGTGVLAVGKRVTISLQWTIISCLLLVFYLLLVRETATGIESASGFALQLNWIGKAFANVFTLIAAFLLVRGMHGSFTLSEMGFTLRQNQGSLMPSIVVTALAIVFTLSLEIILKRDGASYQGLDGLSIFYKGVVHGLDEELFFRGVWLGVLGIALQSRAKEVFGASIDFAGLVMVAVYALMHGLSWNDGSLQFSPIGIGLVAIYGMIYLWLRQRTGSLVVPFVAHTLCNVAALSA